ncbi:MAG: hypothetical protein ACI92B_000453, partial [Marinobacter maritimus]
LCLLPQGFVEGFVKKAVFLVGPVATHPIVPSHLVALSVPVTHCLGTFQGIDYSRFTGRDT